MRSPIRRASSAISVGRLGADRGLAVGQGEELHGLGFQQRLPLGQETPGVGRLLVGIERGPVAVERVEDPLPRLSVTVKAGIHGWAWLAGPADRGRYGYDTVRLFRG